jgi:hypothetical protein
MTSTGVARSFDEATLEGLGVEHEEYIAEAILRWPTIREGQKGAQQRELLFAQPCDIVKLAAPADTANSDSTKTSLRG